MIRFIKVFALKDRKADAFMPPFFQSNAEMAKRSVIAHIQNEPTSFLCLYPEDYDLYQVGDWDDNTGSLQGELPRHICSVYSLIPEGTQNAS